MEKKGGLAATALVVAGLLLRPFAAPAPNFSEPAGKGVSAVVGTMESSLRVTGEGPWVASCRYWASARPAPYRVGEAPDTNTDTNTDANTDANTPARANHKAPGKTAAEKAAEDNSKPPCPGARLKTTAGKLEDDPWGIPAEGIRPEVTAVLATVPDPLHAHQALAFDRTMDALLQAAADNGYVESYFWLPWKPSEEELQEGDPSPAVRDEHRHERERYPGLIVLHYLPRPEDFARRNAMRRDGFARVLYLFLVSETPISGINGEQLTRALDFERDLRNRVDVHARLSTWSDTELAVIGPLSSASVFSLSDGLHRGLARINQSSLPGKGPRTVAHTAPPGPPAITHVRVSSGVSWSLGPGVFEAAGPETVQFRSFTASGAYLTDQLIAGLDGAFPAWNLVQLIEDGTASPQTAIAQAYGGGSDGRVSFIRYPRGISLLRNAQAEQGGATSDAATSGEPYLKMNLHDASREEQMPRFSFEQLPLSQESQLMAIVRQLRRSRAQFVAIRATDTLDSIFLEKFLHRTLPDIRIVSFGVADLLYEREVDNVPFVGGITLTPYNLVAPVASLGQPNVRRPFADAASQQIYNAASYALFRPAGAAPATGTAGQHLPALANYTDLLHEHRQPHGAHPLLWATVVGRDGYFPLGVLNPCASNDLHFLPVVEAPAGRYAAEAACGAAPENTAALPASERIVARPPLPWSILCVLVLLTCAFHVVAFLSADLWSSFARDLNIDQNDEPYRRALYVHIGAVMLFCMAFLVAWPAFAVQYLMDTGTGALALGILTLAAGAAALGVSLWRSRRWFPHRRKRAAEADSGHHPPGQRTLLRLFHTVAHLATVLIPLSWAGCCGSLRTGPPAMPYTGLFFANRCLDLFSGVSPLPPVLFLLVGWFVWSVMQTRRLRFSESTRPRLPGELGLDDEFFFVSDQSINNAHTRERLPLMESMTCLLITPTVLHFLGAHARADREPAAGRHRRHASGMTGTTACILLYALLLLAGVWSIDAWSPERLLRSLAPQGGHSWVMFLPRAAPTLYEALYKTLFLSLMVIASTGALRFVLIWGSLNRGVLRKLERMPLRVAFCRLREMGWFTLMRQNGLIQRRREMARSLESMGQLARLGQQCHPPAPLFADRPLTLRLPAALEQHCESLHYHAQHLTALIENWPYKAWWTRFRNEDQLRAAVFALLPDIPAEPAHQTALAQIYLLEQDFADFGRHLLRDVLIPYWRDHRQEYVESGPEAVGEATLSELPGKPSSPGTQHELFIGLAEEFVALRYISLIRAVLVNVRHLMTFVSVAFVMAIVSWNVYPFRPREAMDTLLTGLLLGLSVCAVWVFAEMYRDPTLSRITDTRPNELGWEFWGRLATFGALPVLTWLAYQFPAVSDMILRYLEPGLEAVK